jgi:hypothetical protein
MSNHQEFDQLPKIAKQLDTDVYLTAEGDRISVREYEERKASIQEGPVVDASDGAHLGRNAEAEKEVTGHTTEDGIKPESHPSATEAVDGKPGHRVAANHPKNDAQVEDPEANTTDEKRANQIKESTPAMTVSNSGTSIEDQTGANKAYNTVAADTNHVLVPKDVTTPAGQDDKVNADAKVENGVTGDRENESFRPDGSVHPVADEPRDKPKGVTKLEETKTVKSNDAKDANGKERREEIRS